MITREEHELLIGYRAIGYKWIARDKSKMLYVYNYKPFKGNRVWETIDDVTSYGYILNSYRANIFKSITWEDEEPTKINDLIRDYESHMVITSEKVKVTVPQYVADWIEEVKAIKLPFALEYLFDTTQMPDDVYDWLDERYGDTDILAKAWLDGYEVEKEKLYTVRLANGSCLYRYVSVGIDWVKGPSDYRDNKDFHLTKSEIESVDPVLMKIAEEVTP